MNVGRAELMALVDKYAAARERAAVAEDRAGRDRDDAFDAKRALDVYLDECEAAEKQRALAKSPGNVAPITDSPTSTVEAPPQEASKAILCLECKHSRPSIKDNTATCKKSGRVVGDLSTKACGEFERLQEVSCLECKFAEREDAATNTWRCTKGLTFMEYFKATCREFEQVDKTSEKPRFCGSCKYCKQSDKDPDGVECTLTRTEFLPIVRWSTACPDFEEAQP